MFEEPELLTNILNSVFILSTVTAVLHHARKRRQVSWQSLPRLPKRIIIEHQTEVTFILTAINEAIETSSQTLYEDIEASSYTKLK